MWRHVELPWVSCEARGFSKQRHGIAVSTGTVVWNTGDDGCLTRRDTLGFMREARVCST